MIYTPLARAASDTPKRPYQLFLTSDLYDDFEMLLGRHRWGRWALGELFYPRISLEASAHAPKSPFKFEPDWPNGQAAVTWLDAWGIGHHLEILGAWPAGGRPWGYGLSYQIPDINTTGIAAEVRHFHRGGLMIDRLSSWRNFTSAQHYSGKVEVSRNAKKACHCPTAKCLPGCAYAKLNKTYWYYNGYLGRSFQITPANDEKGRFFLTSNAIRKYFSKRPTVTATTRRLLHHYTFLLGGCGFAHQTDQEATLVYDLAIKETIPAGHKIYLISGYQVGEYISRPYLRLDLARGQRLGPWGHVYGQLQLGAFLRQQAIEQGVARLDVGYFTPLLPLPREYAWRQLLHVHYLGGMNMLKGQLLSTRTNLEEYFSTPGNDADPFHRGTRRLQVCTETIVKLPVTFKGLDLAATGFVHGVYLQNAKNRVQQATLCQLVGGSLRMRHPYWKLDTLQLKLGYLPLTKTPLVEIVAIAKPLLSYFAIKAPNQIKFG